MKLKKIASLALAGIMTVSMLAGCKNDASSNTEEQPNSTVTVDITSYANSLLSAKEKAVFEFTADSKLDAALKAVATDPDNLSSSEIATEAAKNPTKALVAADTAYELEDELADKLGIKLTAGTYFQGATSNGKDQHKIYVYILSTKLDEQGAVKKVVESIQSNMTSDGSNYFPASQTGYAFDYSANISAVKVTAPDNADNTVWVIAVSYTQTATEASNG